MPGRILELLAVIAMGMALSQTRLAQAAPSRTQSTASRSTRGLNASEGALLKPNEKAGTLQVTSARIPNTSCPLVGFTSNCVSLEEIGRVIHPGQQQGQGPFTLASSQQRHKQHICFDKVLSRGRRGSVTTRKHHKYRCVYDFARDTETIQHRLSHAETNSNALKQLSLDIQGNNKNSKDTDRST